MKKENDFLRGRKVAVWGVNIHTELVLQYCAKQGVQTIVVDTDCDNPQKMAENPQILNGKAKEYFVVVDVRKFHPEIEERLLEFGYTKEDYLFMAHPPIYVSDEDADSYCDVYGNRIIGEKPKQCEIKFRGFGAKVTFGENCRFGENCKLSIDSRAEFSVGNNIWVEENNRFVVDNGGRMVIGNSCHLQANCMLSCKSDSVLEIGDNLRTGMYCWFNALQTGIRIGNDCLFSHKVTILVNDIHPIYDVTSGEIVNMDPDFMDEVIIEDHVWLGVNSVIVGKAVVGRCSVVGANSVVKKDVPAHCVAVGTLARVIRENITWSVQPMSKEKLMLTDFWEL